jgi:hypothetical protein
VVGVRLLAAQKQRLRDVARALKSHFAEQLARQARPGRDSPQHLRRLELSSAAGLALSLREPPLAVDFGARRRLGDQREAGLRDAGGASCRTRATARAHCGCAPALASPERIRSGSATGLGKSSATTPRAASGGALDEHPVQRGIAGEGLMRAGIGRARLGRGS